MEISAHLGFVLEAVISQNLVNDNGENVIDDNGDIVTVVPVVVGGLGELSSPMKLKRDETANEQKFIDAIVKLLKFKAGGVSFPSIERFKRDCTLYLSPTDSASPPKEGPEIADQKPSIEQMSITTPVEEDKDIFLTEANMYGFDFLFPQNTHDKV